MPDQPIDVSATPVSAAWTLQGTPEEEAELKMLLERIDRRIADSEARIDRVLIRMGIEP